uniref:Uncharacterized protein n=1 Tax=Rhizophora mucronata TaxID=61149 RepID=A0A2P2Q103_RHIMU
MAHKKKKKIAQICNLLITGNHDKGIRLELIFSLALQRPSEAIL